MAAFAPPVRRSAARRARPEAAATHQRPKPPVRAKLKVSDPGDPSEREADRTADRVMRAAKPFPQAGPRGDDERPARKAKDEKPRRKAKDEKPRRKTKDEKPRRKAKEEKPRRKAKEERAQRTVEQAPGALEDKTAQREAAPGTGGGSEAGFTPPGFESSLGRARQAGGGRLGGDTLQMMESGFDRPLGGVRVYSDGAAAGLAGAIDARAFTLGNDIFFGAGEYQPHSHDGRRLLAHELAHVVQQSSGMVSTSAVQRQGTEDTTRPVTTGTPAAAGGTPAPPPDPPQFVGREGRRIVKQPEQGKQGTFYLPALQIPTIGDGVKGASNHPNADLQGRPAEGRNPLISGQPFKWTGKTDRGSTSARRQWIAAAQADAALQSDLTTAVRTHFGGGATGGSGSAPARGAGGEPAPLAAGGQPTYYLQPASPGPRFFVVGTAEEIARHELVVLPVWNERGERHEFQVDHVYELQLGGLDGWQNFCVLDATANQSSGARIFDRFRSDVNALIHEAETGGFWPGRGGDVPNFEQVRQNWNIRYDRPVGDLSITGQKGIFWTRSQIQRGAHLPGLRAMTEHEIVDAGLRFRPGERPTRLSVFTNANGGYTKGLQRSGEVWAAREAGAFYRGFTVSEICIDPFESVEHGRRVGALRGTALGRASKNGKVFPPLEGVPMPLLQSSNLGFGLWVDREAFKNELRRLRINQMSPVTIDDAGISAVGVVFVEGRIQTTLPLFAGLEIPFAIYGDELTIEFPIPTDRLRLGPVQVTEASLAIGVNPDGLALGGMVGFEVRGVGRGRLEARASTEEAAPPAAGAGGTPAAGSAPAGGEPGFSLVGSFNFDSDKLDPASITVAYRNHEFTVDALVGLRQGSVRGLESAEIHLRSGQEGILFEGTAVLGIPALRATALTVSRNEAGHITIGADNIPLPITRIPGVRSATASIHVQREAETGEWRVSGGGAAEIGVGGFTGGLRVDVSGPFVTIAGENLQIRRGPLEGSGNFVVTNRPRDEAGRPLEEGEPAEMTASGHAEASLPLGRYLRGTIGGTILPNGELEFTGGVALPPTVDLFAQRRFERDLFRPPSLDIPIFGISAAGQRIGIFATIGGSLSFIASVGPGQLRDTALEASFNPDHPEATTVHGQANFVVPAQAGLRLEIHGGIGAGIPVVSAEAGIEVGGQLGIAAEASAGVTVDWTPASGLAVAAVAHLSAQPQFTFDISAYVRITADVLITEFELYSERWRLASFTFGPQLTFGVDLPIRWTEQQGLAFDPSAIQIQRPDIDFRQLGSDLIRHLVA